MRYHVSPLLAILDHYRRESRTQREKGTYFEELIRTYFRHEPVYQDLYREVWLYADWAKEHGATYGLSAKDTGIDLVAQTHGTEEFHAIQCKCYDEGHRVRKAEIDSFFTASGQKPFTHRIIVTTTNDWSENAENSLIGQTPPVTKIDLLDLENSQIDWAKFQSTTPSAAPILKQKKSLRSHQESALTNVKLGLKSADRGKLIMACGTGKTFTSLKIAEELAGSGKRVLFLVPSLNLLSQTLSEWTQESATPLHSFAVCSDAEVGKKRDKDEDVVQTFAHELRYPATTDARRLAHEMQKRHDAHHMSVVFSTYHSLEVVSRAQHLHSLPDFDFIICDEAHRTTGATFESEIESTFVRVHDAAFLRATKRLYMTATPRIYADVAKASAERDNVTLCSMDDEAVFGKQLHVITFSEAVQLKLLTDYKVLVLTISEDHVSSRMQELLKDDNNQLKVDDAARIIGCWKALSKQGLAEDLAFDPQPMRRAVAFCQVIERQKAAKVHKVSSKQISEMFQVVVDEYLKQEGADLTLRCEAKHVDGSMNAGEKESKLSWLKAEPPLDTCRILSNVRCLSEGVDVPALDAVLFLTPRSSPIDVVQSVGRVMRNAPGKKRGYVILPVVIPAGMEAHEALNDNKVYKVVWEVLQALRSHDDRFDAFVNKLDLIGHDHRKMEVVSITDKVQKKSASTSPSERKGPDAAGGNTIGTPVPGYTAVQAQLQFQVGELERALYARVVKKCGNPNHWEEWANDIAKIANTHISRITQIVSNPENTKECHAFSSFAAELRDDLNDSITDAEVIEMLAQHLITKPVFDALFEDYSFASQNPVSQAMQKVLDVLQEHRLEKEADTLEKFYASVKMRAASINDVTAKQKIVVELYDKFFRNAFPRMTERLGIVYTPVEVVDFIIHSVNDLLQQEFGQSLGSKGVHIIDPFTGTGTFITRLLQSGLIKPEELEHKYKHEIHANEIVLLAYYIAAINIEAVYHSLLRTDHCSLNTYQPFEGICLTDTFQMYEKGDLISDLMEDNSARRKRQKALDIRVIIGNPPYSVGQTSANDNNQNVSYPGLDERIAKTYAAGTDAVLKNSLYDSYVRAIRWASDRVGDCGVIGFVTNAGFIDSASGSGLRKCLIDEFSSLYIFHLRGNQRTSGELSRKEGGKIFGSGSRAPIAISLLIKNPNSVNHGKLFYRDIGDYLSTEIKLSKIKSFASINGIKSEQGWTSIIPDSFGDWINKRDTSFSTFLATSGRDLSENLKIFSTQSGGIKSNRDVWIFNSSRKNLESNICRTINFYNAELERIIDSHCQSSIQDDEIETLNDSTNISWTRGLRDRLKKQKSLVFMPDVGHRAIYRPFTAQWVYLDSALIEVMSKIPSYFPDKCSNLIIWSTGIGATVPYSCWISDELCSLQQGPAAVQHFPLYVYEKTEEAGEGELFSQGGTGEGGYTRRDAITYAGLQHFQSAYPAAGDGSSITKEDLFYYIYGLLHSPDYRSRYADNLSKELPRIPAVKTYADFRAFESAGRQLAHWHLNYETVACHPAVKVAITPSAQALPPEKRYRVTKMKFAKTKDPATGKSINDKTTVIYNESITVSNIPLGAYDYVVNGKPAIEWVIERQCISTDKDSGITNDANLYATETMNNPQYPLELLQRVVTVSEETNKIVASLPNLELQ